jgi:hypothetical protein
MLADSPGKWRSLEIPEGWGRAAGLPHGRQEAHIPLKKKR